MTGTNFAATIRNYTRTNSTTLTDAEIVLLANVVKDELAPLVMEADEDIFGIPATRNLVASDANDFTAREYSLPDDYLAIKRVEAKLDGSNWIALQELDLSQYNHPTTESEVINRFNNSAVDVGNPQGARYDIFRKSLWLYSGTISAVTGGLKLWYIAFPKDIATGDLSGSTDLSIDPDTTHSSLPRQLHELWARRVSILWKSNREKPIPLNEREVVYGTDLKRQINMLKNPNKDRELVGRLPDDSRLQY